jgi:hypothetical protein
MRPFFQLLLVLVGLLLYAMAFVTFFEGAEQLAQSLFFWDFARSCSSPWLFFIALISLVSGRCFSSLNRYHAVAPQVTLFHSLWNEIGASCPAFKILRMTILTLSIVLSLVAFHDMGCMVWSSVPNTVSYIAVYSSGQFEFSERSVYARCHFVHTRKLRSLAAAEATLTMRQPRYIWRGDNFYKENNLAVLLFLIETLMASSVLLALLIELKLKAAEKGWLERLASASSPRERAETLDRLTTLALCRKQLKKADSNSKELLEVVLNAP